MIEKVKILEERYSEISEKLSEPDTVNDQELYRELMKEYKNLTPIVE